MFNLEPELKAIAIQGKTVLTLIQSINQPMVAAADYPAEETQAYVVTLKSPDHSLETFIYLHLHQTNQCVIYQFSESPFMGDRLQEAEGEALDFVESMGFMMDNMRFDKLADPERQRLTQETPFFYPTLREFEPILQARRKREEKQSAQQEDPSISGDLREIVKPVAGEKPPPAEGIPEAEVVTELEEVIDANDVSDLADNSFLGEPQTVNLDDTVVVEKTVDPDEPAPDSIDEDLAEAFSDLQEEGEKQTGRDEDLSSFFDPRAESQPTPSGGGQTQRQTRQAESEDLSALDEMEASLAVSAGEGKPSGSSETVVNLQELSEEEWRDMLGLLLGL